MYYLSALQHRDAFTNGEVKGRLLFNVAETQDIGKYHEAEQMHQEHEHVYVQTKISSPSGSPPHSSR